MAVTASGISPGLASPNEIEHWLAARQTGQDVVTAGLAERFCATLGLRENDALAPPGTHWCLAPEAPDISALGPDGLPAKGGIIPPLRRLTSRVWAGVELAFHTPLRIGAPVVRVSRLAGLTERFGRAGTLVFARIENEFHVGDAVSIGETQVIAYRDPGAPMPAGTAPPPQRELHFSRTIPTTPALLFRWSALTFNPHRIHYDQPYATAVEGHAGLLVQGTLTAALLLNACASHVGAAAMATASIRALQPAYCGGSLTVGGCVHDREASLSAYDAAGALVMQGTVQLR